MHGFGELICNFRVSNATLKRSKPDLVTLTAGDQIFETHPFDGTMGGSATSYDQFDDCFRRDLAIRLA